MKVVRVVAVAFLAMVLFSAPPAGAQTSNASPCAPGGPARPTNPGGQYPPQDCGVGANRSEVGPGGQVNLTGECPAGTESVTFRLIPSGVGVGAVDLGQAVPDANGNYTATVTIPATAVPGSYQIEATCTGVRGANVVRSVAIAVVAPASAARGGMLPRTGAASMLPLGGAGIALLALGGVAIVAARRRRTPDAA